MSIKAKDIRRLSRIRIGTIPKSKVIQNKKQFNRKNKRKDIEEQLMEYYEENEWRW